MTLQPTLLLKEYQGQPSLAVEYQGRYFPGLKMSFAERPIPAAFREFQHALPDGRGPQSVGESRGMESSTALYVSTLNYATLKTISKVCLEWVSDLSSHLEFDPTSRLLYIFRFPSFCALSTLNTSHTVILERYVKKWWWINMVWFYWQCNRLVCSPYGMNSEDLADLDTKLSVSARLRKEILMSLRLLFGQTRRSRAQIKMDLKELRDRDEFFDPLFETVCITSSQKVNVFSLSSFWPDSCRTIDGEHLQEEGSYSSREDFPMCGQRLARLQAFTLRQQPSNLRDLWRDRRNPLQWYTFWAVLIVGGLSILLALLQLGVAVAPLVVAMRPPTHSW